MKDWYRVIQVCRVYMKKLLMSVIVSMSLVCSLFCQAETNISEFKLDNGLKIIVKPDKRAPVVMSLLMYHIGASYEPSGITGISHALEHMMFKGTKQYPAGKYSHIISDNGGSLNAFTGNDFTGYHVQIAADKLPLVLKLEADRMNNLNLDNKEFVKEIEVVKEERHLRTENVPEALTYEQFQAAAFLGIPYHNPVVGWPSDLDNMKIGDLKAWYKTWYRPNNATLVVVGDVDPQNVYKLAKKYFGPIKRGNLPVVKTFQSVPTHGLRKVTVARPAEVPILFIGYNVPSATTAKEKWEPYALDVLAGILSAGDSGRFSKHLIREQNIATSVNTSYGLYYRLPYLFTIDAVPAPGTSIKQLRQAILKEIKALQTTPISMNELNRIKAQNIAWDVYGKDSISHQAVKYGSLESVGLTWKESDNYMRQIAAVTPEQVQQVAKKYLIPTQMTVAVLKPEKTTSQSSSSPMTQADQGVQ